MKRLPFFMVLISVIVLSSCSPEKTQDPPTPTPSPFVETTSIVPAEPEPSATTTLPTDHLQLTFVSDQKEGYYGIYAMDVLCGELKSECFGAPKLLFERDSIILEYDWSPDGQRIVFVGPGQDGFLKSSDLYLANWDGSNVINLTQSDDPEEFPVWSADGRSILYSSVQNGLSEKAYRLDLASGITTEILAASDVQNIRFPTPGQDDEKVIFVEDSSFGNVLYYSDISGENKVEITRHPLQIFDPEFSPDQRIIIFVVENEDKPTVLTDLYFVNLDGSGKHKLLLIPDFQPLNPAWSRSLDLIAFSGKYITEKVNLRDIYIVSLDDSGLVKITGNNGNNSSPKWRFDLQMQVEKDN
jgi:Tol biopolymer transport system component